MRDLVLAGLLSIVLMHLPSIVCADSPEALMNRIVQRLNQEKSYAVLIEFVHWERLFESLPKNARKKLGIKSSTQLKTSYRLTLVEKLLSADIHGPGQESSIGDASGSNSNGDDQKLKRLQREQTMGRFRRGAIRVNEKRASADLVVETGDSAATHKLALHEIDGRWFLVEPAFQVELPFHIDGTGRLFSDCATDERWASHPFCRAN